MITSIHSYGGVTATVYVMNKGEKIPRHQHSFAHTTAVAAGKSEVEIYDSLSTRFTMETGDNPWELPANIDHEIRALEDGTVVVNMAVGIAAAVAAPGPAAQDGGVALHDGTVV
jgi:quercetin dioxygenase-like cupin family protein